MEVDKSITDISGLLAAMLDDEDSSAADTSVPEIPLMDVNAATLEKVRKQKYEPLNDNKNKSLWFSGIAVPRETQGDSHSAHREGICWVALLI